MKPKVSTFAFRPANRPDRLYDLAIVDRTDAIPGYDGVATDKFTDLVVDGERDIIVPLLLGDDDVLILFRNHQADGQVFAKVQARMRTHRLNIVEVREATPAILGVFRNRRANDVEIVQVKPRSDDNKSLKLFHKIVATAVQTRGTSDIHIMVDRQYANVKLRVHGDLEQFMPLHHDEAEALSRTIFHIADPDSKPVAFSERVAQPAAVEVDFHHEGRRIHVKLRYGSIPINGGWDLALRILPIGAEGYARDLPTLEYDDAQIHDFQHMLSRPRGMIVMCGPTGSGKSTTIATLCGMLYDMHEGRRLIRSIEDPVEYIMRGVRQSSVVRRGNSEEQDESSFSNMLIAAMRADPDILMFGEIRDKVSAQIAQQGVQTGHKLLTTVHAGHPFEAYDRLIDLGMERTVLTGNDFVSGIVHQALLPIVCPECAYDWDRAKAISDPGLCKRIERVADKRLERLRFRGNGCEKCNHTGKVGRTVAAAMLIPDRQIQQYMLDKDRLRAEASWRAAKGVAQDNPYAPRTIGRTALDQAIEKMCEGRVSPQDVEKAFGFMDDQRSPIQEREWLRRRNAEQERHG